MKADYVGQDLIAVSAYSRLGGSTRVRLYDWLDWVGKDYGKYEFNGRNANGIGSLIKSPIKTFSSIRDLNFLSQNIKDSTVILSRQATPFGFGNRESSILKNSAYGIYDLDDALFSEREGVKGLIRSNSRICKESFKAADTVIVGNDYLADFASSFSNSVFVIPSCVNLGQYKTKTDFELHAPPTAVWIGSSASEKFLLELEEPLLLLNKKYSLRVKLIGSSKKTLGHLERIVDRVQWSEDTFADQLQQSDFGIMPLVHDEYSLGKCAYKILQYAASSLPIVASPVGANLRAIQLLGAFQATSGDDWFDQIELLINMGTRQRELLGISALMGVTQHYSFGAWEDKWLGIIQKHSHIFGQGKISNMGKQ